ncbi:MAG: SBBP repeat-containing protein [Leptospiraceae bacterium]|nr:SBBP repeat-containing protein [Leptospiraceae bacterium]MCP5497241.1 SBBP repeat-containing protein [Leptospiraceae bacterium]
MKNTRAIFYIVILFLSHCLLTKSEPEVSAIDYLIARLAQGIGNINTAESGSMYWIKQYGVEGKETTAVSVVSDLNDDIYVTGYTNGNLDGIYQTSGESHYDLFVKKFNSEGEGVWTELLGVKAANTYPTKILSDLQNNVYVLGNTNGDLDKQVKSGSGTDGFIIKYDGNGNKLWTKLQGHQNANTYFVHGAFSLSENLYIVYYTQTTNNDSITYYITKYDSTGEMQWDKKLGYYHDVQANGIIVDQDEAIYITGSTTQDLNGESVTGLTDLFVIKLNKDKTVLWTKLLGVSSTSTLATDIASDGENNFFVTGHTYGSLNGEETTGYWHLFLIKYDRDGNTWWTRILLDYKSRFMEKMAYHSQSHIYMFGGESPFFLSSYNTKGEKKWSMKLNVYLKAITADTQGYAYLIGTTANKSYSFIAKCK